MNLIKASDLALPRISGTVSVNLEELDRLRAEHATAVKLAQELESKQALVKIVVGENKCITGSYAYDSKGREKYIQGSTQFVQQSVEYKGFDEFRESIRLEEYAKIEKDMSTLRAEIDKYRNASQEHANNHSLFKNKYEETFNKLRDLEKRKITLGYWLKTKLSDFRNLR